jgi:hypothetical protein
MYDMPKITWSQLWAVLEDFRDWYEFEWLGEDSLVDDGGMNAIDYFIRSRQSNPNWPDVTQEPR